MPMMMMRIGRDRKVRLSAEGQAAPAQLRYNIEGHRRDSRRSQESQGMATGTVRCFNSHKGKVCFLAVRS